MFKGAEAIELGIVLPRGLGSRGKMMFLAGTQHAKELLRDEYLRCARELNFNS